jgi:hypothetical protein
MNSEEKQAIAEVLESYFTPDSPEGLAGAMYQLRRIYENETRRRKRRRGPQAERHTTRGNHGATRTGDRREVPGDLRGQGEKPSRAILGMGEACEILK